MKEIDWFTIILATVLSVVLLFFVRLAYGADTIPVIIWTENGITHMSNLKEDIDTKKGRIVLVDNTKDLPVNKLSINNQETSSRSEPKELTREQKREIVRNHKERVCTTVLLSNYQNKLLVESCNVFLEERIQELDRAERGS